MDYTAADFWLKALHLIGLVALGIYTWWVNREKVTAKRFRALEDDVRKRATEQAVAEIERRRIERCEAHMARVAEAERAISKLGTEVTHMPSRSELGRMTDTLTQISRKLGNLEGRLDGINRVAGLMNEFLIGQGGKR